MRYRADSTLTVLAAILSIAGCGGAERRQVDTSSAGGGTLTPQQVLAVAAYVYSLSHPGTKPS